MPSPALELISMDPSIFKLLEEDEVRFLITIQFCVMSFSVAGIVDVVFDSGRIVFVRMNRCIQELT